MQVKLSVAGDVSEKGLKSVAWAGPGVLAAATTEKMVRLLDLAADESYNLSTTKQVRHNHPPDSLVSRLLSVPFGGAEKECTVAPHVDVRPCVARPLVKSSTRPTAMWTGASSTSPLVLSTGPSPPPAPPTTDANANRGSVA